MSMVRQEAISQKGRMGYVFVPSRLGKVLYSGRRLMAFEILLSEQAVRHCGLNMFCSVAVYVLLL